MRMPFETASSSKLSQELSPEERANAALRLFLGNPDCKLWRLFPHDIRGQLVFDYKNDPSDSDVIRYGNKLRDVGLKVVVEEIPLQLNHRVILNETWENIIKILSNHLTFFGQNKSPVIKPNTTTELAPVVASAPLLSSQLVPQNGVNNNQNISAPYAKKESSANKPLNRQEQQKLDQERECQQANLAVQTFIGRQDCTLWSLFHHHDCQLEFKDPKPQYYELQSYAKRLKEAGLNAELEELPHPTPPRVMIRNLREKIITVLNKANLSNLVPQNLMLSSIHKPSAAVLPAPQLPKEKDNQIPLASSALVPVAPALPVSHPVKPATAPAVVPAKQCKPYAEPIAPQQPMANIPASNNNSKDAQDLLKELEKLRAEKAELLATINKQQNALEIVDEDKATIRAQLQYYFDKIPQYPDKAVELIRKVTTHYKKVKNTLEENVKDIINFAFVGTNISDEDTSELCADLGDIQNVANKGREQLKLKGEYSQQEIAKMVYDISIEYILTQQAKYSSVKPAAIADTEMNMSDLALTLKRSGSPVHQSVEISAANMQMSDALRATAQSTVQKRTLS